MHPFTLLFLIYISLITQPVQSHFLRSKSSVVVLKKELVSDIGDNRGGLQIDMRKNVGDDEVYLGEKFGLRDDPREWKDVIRDFTEDDDSTLLITAPHLLKRLVKKDCHSLLIESVDAICGGENGGEGGEGGTGVVGEDRMTDENDRISLAISLTLCSIDTLNQKGPIECNLWSPFQFDSFDYGILRDSLVDEKAMEMRGACLRALHRSPQDWSSYNGYLSDANKLCHSLESTRRFNMVNALYVNITMEKLALLKMMNTHERRKWERDESKEKKWDEKMEDLRRTTESLHTDETTMSSLLSTTTTASHSLISALSQALEEITRGGRSFWDEMRQHRSREVGEVVQEMRGSWRTEGRVLLDDLATGLSYNLDQFSMAMSDRVVEIEDSIYGVTSKLEAHGHAVLDDHIDRQNAIGVRWQELDLVGSSITGRLDHIDDHIASLPSALETSVNMANELNTLQASHKHALQETVDVAQTLRETLFQSAAEASDTVTALQDIRAELQQDRWRSSNSRGLTSWLLGMVFSPLSLVATGPTTLLPIVKILGYALDVVLGLMGTIIYVATSLWLVLRTGAWRLLRSAVRLAYGEYWKVREEVSSEDAESQLHLPHYRRAIMPGPSKAATDTRRVVTQPLPVHRTHYHPHHDQFFITRRHSRGMQLDRLARRAQSEPL